MYIIRAAIREVLEEIKPATVRQVFYALVSRGVIDKTEAEYKSTVCRLLVDMRREEVIPYGWIADSTRWMRKPKSYTGLVDMLSTTRDTYRRALWSTQPAYVEVWLEKDALAGVLYTETAEWDVPLMVTRGYPSLSFLHEAAQELRHQESPAFIYYLGDRDPSGVDIPRFVEKELRSRAPDTDITFTLLAVTVEQIEQFELPTRPTKKTDTRSKSFVGESVEVDAIPPAALRTLVCNSIVQHIDEPALRRLERTEELERETLDDVLYSIQIGAMN